MHHQALDVAAADMRAVGAQGSGMPTSPRNPWARAEGTQLLLLLLLGESWVMRVLFNWPSEAAPLFIDAGAFQYLSVASNTSPTSWAVSCVVARKLFEDLAKIVHGRALLVV